MSRSGYVTQWSYYLLPDPSSDSPEVVSFSSQTDLNIVGADSTIDVKDCNLKRRKSRSLPHVTDHNHTHPSAIHTLHPTTPSSIIPLRRVQSPSSVSATISPYSNFRNLRRCSSDISLNSSAGKSALTAIKTFFRNSGSHIRSTLTTPVSSPRGSPRSSPLLGRRRFKDQNKEEERENEFVHWWMGDVTPGEATHWTQVIEREGKWVYYWHSIRYKLKSVLY